MTHRNDVNDFAFCEDCLVKVSRTFAINIKVLKGNAYKGILLAYLLCRIADTIEDDPFFPTAFKVQKLCEYANLFPPAIPYFHEIEDFLTDISFTEENDATVLLLNLGRVFNEFVTLPKSMVAVISDHVNEMALGMASFQKKGADRGIIFLEDHIELARYCYFVAGTVGLMITSIFSENSPSITAETRKKLEDRSVSFGLGLQITNIAKDFYGDHERGWCYVPRSFFIDENIDPVRDTFHDKPEGFVNAHKRLIKLALTYLDEALLYTLDIPRTLIRYRLFCLWPLFMALESLAKLSGEQNLFKGEIIKISRNDVTRIVRNTSLGVMSNTALKSMYHRTRNKIRV